MCTSYRRIGPCGSIKRGERSASGKYGIKKDINFVDGNTDVVESPPLWAWAVIVAAIIAGKLVLRWSRLKRLARMLERRNSN
jgi:hypothetical protein